MLEDVGERLLHDPVGREVDARRGRRPLALDPGLDRHARLGTRVDQPSRRGQAGGRRQLSRASAASARSTPSRRRISSRPVAAGVADRLEDALGLGGLAVDDVGADARLHRHHAHGVGDDVVQLPGDAQALLGHRPPGRLDPLPLLLRRPQLQLLGVASRTFRLSPQTRPWRRAPGCPRACRRPCPGVGDHQGDRGAAPAAGDGDPPVAARRQRVEGDSTTNGRPLSG